LFNGNFVKIVPAPPERARDFPWHGQKLKAKERIQGQLTNKSARRRSSLPVPHRASTLYNSAIRSRNHRQSSALGGACGSQFGSKSPNWPLGLRSVSLAAGLSSISPSSKGFQPSVGRAFWPCRHTRRHSYSLFKLAITLLCCGGGVMWRDVRHCTLRLLASQICPRVFSKHSFSHGSLNGLKTILGKSLVGLMSIAVLPTRTRRWRLRSTPRSFASYSSLVSSF
jgi:hypothetical protein